jgi:hypothetical protein
MGLLIDRDAVGATALQVGEILRSGFVPYIPKPNVP